MKSCLSADLEPFRRVKVYTSSDFVYLAGGRGQDGHEECSPELMTWRILRFDRKIAGEESLKDCIYQIPHEYSYKELNAFMMRFSCIDSTKPQWKRPSTEAGITWLMDAVALIGCVRFVKGFYLVLVTKSSEEGEIEGSKIYSCKGTELVPLFNPVNEKEDTEMINPSGRIGNDSNEKKSTKSKLWSYWFPGKQNQTTMTEEYFLNLFKLVDLSKGFFWSYTYDLTRSLQNNVAERTLRQAHAMQPEINLNSPDDCFFWNSYLSQPFFETPDHAVPSSWVVKLIHGSFRQQRCSIFSRSISLILIARRSRHFAGTRYRKRGLNDQGHVANEVEIEQIVEDHMILPNSLESLSSFVQVRGSIPTFWSQESSVATPKPPIRQLRYDPWYTATRMHFSNLFRRYGDAIYVVNLVKHTEARKHETIVGSDFKNALERLNATLPDNLAIHYRAVDFARLCKTDPRGLLNAIDIVAREALIQTSFFTTRTSNTRILSISPAVVKWLYSSESSNDLLAKMLLLPRQRIHMHSEADRSNKIPMRWSSRKRKFVPMRVNSAVRLSPRRSTQEKNCDVDDDEESFSTINLVTVSSNKSQTSECSVFEHGSDYNDDGSEGYRSDDLDFGPITYDALFTKGLEAKELLNGSKSKNPLCLPFSSSPSLTFSVSSTSDSLDRCPNYSPLPFLDRNGSSRPSSFPLRKSLSSHQERIQCGVIRTNCIDCLDRTNIVQFLIGLRVLNEQLIALRIIEKSDNIGTDSSISTLLMEMYEQMGDLIALQYGGSDAHRKSGRLTLSGASSTSRHQSLYTSIKRYYSNVFTDQSKQDSMNIFLGLYRWEHRQQLIEKTDNIARSNNNYSSEENNCSNVGFSGTPSEASHHPNDFYLHNREVMQPPNVTMRPQACVVGTWWTDPLSEYLQRIFLPVIALSLNSSCHYARIELVSNQDSCELFSFDNYLAKPYVTPRELVDKKLDDGEIIDDKVHSERNPKSEAQTLKSNMASNLITLERPKTWGVNHASWSSVSTNEIDVAQGKVFESASLHESLTKDNELNCTSVSQEFTDNIMETVKSPEIDAVSKDYLKQQEEPFQCLYEAPSELASEKPCESWNRAENKRQFKEAMSDYAIAEDDVWGMRRLQAYSSTTNILMHGRFKGYPRTFPSAELTLNESLLGKSTK